MVSYEDYKIGKELSRKDYSFYALLQATMRQADTENLQKLTLLFPETRKELAHRITSPEGLLPEERK